MYGLLITFGITIGALLAEKEARNKSLNTDILWEGLLVALIFGVIGARIYHVIDYWSIYKLNLINIFKIWQGGLGIFGAIIGASIAILIYLYRKNDLNIKWFDVATLYLPLGQFIGRWGNYFNNELLPYAIYESILDLCLFLVLFAINKKAYKEGRIFSLYLIGYSTIRLVLEDMREVQWKLYGINVAQGVSLTIIIAILIIYVVRSFRSRRI